MPTIRITPRAVVAGIMLDVEMEGIHDTVGPVAYDIEMVAVFEHPNLSAGRSPPTKEMKKLSFKQEQRNAALIGGKRQPGSGASNRAKGDTRAIGEYRGESKYTFAKSYSLELATLEKILGECGDGEKPILCLDYRNKTNNKVLGSYVVLHESDFEELRNAAAHNRRPPHG